MNKTKISIITVIFLILLTLINIPLSPINNLHTTNTTIKFEKLGYGPILIDNNKEFSSPILLKEPFIVDLEPDAYYWKSAYISKVNAFTIDSEVTINLVKKQDDYIVQNKGNTPINLLIRNLQDWLITGFSVLDVGSEINLDIKNESVVIASQK